MLCLRQISGGFLPPKACCKVRVKSHLTAEKWSCLIICDLACDSPRFGVWRGQRERGASTEFGFGRRVGCHDERVFSSYYCADYLTKLVSLNWSQKVQLISLHLLGKKSWMARARLHGLRDTSTSSPVIVVVVRLRVIVIFHHGEGDHVGTPLVCGTQSLHHLSASVWEVSMDGQVPIVLELELLLSRY